MKLAARFSAVFPAVLSTAVSIVLVVAMSLIPVSAFASQISGAAQNCIVEASTYHSVNSSILEAIVRHESRGRADVVSRNTNGSVDIGLTGINSIHIPELMSKGVAPSRLKDECVSIYVGAWKLSQSMFKYGNSWWAVGAYHSKTPRYNLRYQALIYNELVGMGVMLTPKANVPPQ